MIWLVPGIMGEDADQHVSECCLGEESNLRHTKQMAKEKGEKKNIQLHSSLLKNWRIYEQPPGGFDQCISTCSEDSLYSPAVRGGWRGSRRRTTWTPTTSRRRSQMEFPELSEHGMGFHFILYILYFTFYIYILHFIFYISHFTFYITCRHLSPGWPAHA